MLLGKNRKMIRELNEKIDGFHKTLDHRDIVPEGCYRRNNLHHRLICYINNIIGLYLSSDFDSIPIFISRAYKEVIFITENFEELCQKKCEKHLLSRRLRNGKNRRIF